MADPRDEGFKVVDKRLFTEQGELRQEMVEQERRDEEAAAKKAAAAPAKASAQNAAKTSNSSGLVSQDGSVLSPLEEPKASENEIAPSRNFQMLIDFLTRNAAAMLGGMADPRTGQAFLDLEGAREMIDMMDELREKTRGNLAKADDDLLMEVLGSLKLSYMEVARAAAERMKKQAGGKQ